MENFENQIANLEQRVYEFPFIVKEPTNYETVYEDGIPVCLTAAELLAVAKLWMNGTFDDIAGFNNLPKSIKKKLEDGITPEVAKRIEEGCGCSYEDMDIVFESLPLELHTALEQITGKEEVERYTFDPHNQKFQGGYLPVDLHYTHVWKGKTIEEICPYAMSLDIAVIMNDILWKHPQLENQFSYLKEVAPEVYECVYIDIHTWCNNLHLNEYKRCVDIQLKDFPAEVFEPLKNA